ncbi:hypothetical protein ON010_g5745 [Phytophthora cinnamomi]|nr:hypothetical protein ON010_g5745 [Phytophthora cinnamomi]
MDFLALEKSDGVACPRLISNTVAFGANDWHVILPSLRAWRGRIDSSAVCGLGTADRKAKPKAELKLASINGTGVLSPKSALLSTFRFFGQLLPHDEVLEFVSAALRSRLQRVI